MAINGAQFLAAIDELEASKGISKEVIINALKEAMIKGYKKSIGATEEDDNVRVNIDAETGSIEMYQIKKVIDGEPEDDFLEISVEDANALKDGKKYKSGDELIIPSSPEQLTKAIAMSVKSILKQKFAEAEKDVLFETFKDKIGTMITGKVEKADERGLSVNIGKTSVYLPHNQMIGDEKFNAGDSIKLFVNNVASGTKGAHIIVTRASEGFLKCLFSEEIHEIYDGTIVIKAIAREAGERSKVSVYAEDPNIDPAGACIGPNGSRIQKIVGQLGNGNAKEKIDIITYSDVPGLYIMESLKPAKVVGIKVDLENKSALVIVRDDSFSLAIGRKGVNVRLAVKLTGFNIDIKTETEAYEENIEFQSYEELQALDAEQKSKAAYEKLAAQYRQNETTTDVLPGLPEGYVAPQARVYEEEGNEELDEALEQASEKEELKLEAPASETKEEVKEEKVEEEKPVEVKKEVKTTTSIEDLEKSLSEQSNKSSNKGKKFTNKKKKEETSEDDSSKSIVDTSNAKRMSIYTEEELREMEEEEKNENEDDYDEDVDYDEYDEYYDDDDR